MSNLAGFKVSRNVMIVAALILVVTGGSLYWYFTRPIEKESLIVSTTTSLYETGVLDVLKTRFEADNPKYNVSFISQGTGLAGLQSYIRTNREKDFVDNLCRKMLVYALGRSLMLSDEPLIQRMNAKLAAGGYRIGILVESIATSPQFLKKRTPVQKGG